MNMKDTIANFLQKDLNVPVYEDIEEIEEIEEARPSDEQWVWVTGYKGTDKNMRGHGEYQFELEKQYDIPEGVEILPCRSGFHLCLALDNVFNYYPIDYGNRFFEVRALVRKSDIDNSAHTKSYGHSKHIRYERQRKLVAKSVIFVRELSTDEVLADMNVEGWSVDDKRLARERGTRYARNARNKDELLGMGYSERVVEHLIKNGRTKLALILGSQEGLSMDTKIQILFNSNDD